MSDQTLDLTGLRCPLPILRAKKALAAAAAGSVITVLATDPGAPGDFAAFCRHTGHELLSSETLENGVFQMVIRRKAA